LREALTLSDGSIAMLATRKLVVANGDAYTGREAVEPDILVRAGAGYVEPEPEPPILTDQRLVSAGEIETRQLRLRVAGDVALTRAVDVLLGLKALNIQGFTHGASLDR
jgi:hypothetical protein